MNTIIIDFKEDATATSLYTDDIDLRQLGKLSVKRASHVEFNSDSQRWEVRFPGSDVVQFSRRDRSACIAWEIEHFQTEGFPE